MDITINVKIILGVVRSLQRHPPPPPRPDRTYPSRTKEGTFPTQLSPLEVLVPIPELVRGTVFVTALLPETLKQLKTVVNVQNHGYVQEGLLSLNLAATKTAKLN
jgi:hypothetical protein